MTKNDISNYQIFPAIGIARVGDNRQQTYVAPEAPQIHFVPSGGYRARPDDSQDQRDGARRKLAPQALGSLGGIPSDFTRPVAAMPLRIKRMGCRFRIYEFHPAGVPLREINARRLEMGGELLRDKPGVRYVKLGDIETDEKGRLIVYGGHGVAESWREPPNPLEWTLFWPTTDARIAGDEGSL